MARHERLLESHVRVERIRRECDENEHRPRALTRPRSEQERRERARCRWRRTAARAASGSTGRPTCSDEQHQERQGGEQSNHGLGCRAPEAASAVERRRSAGSTAQNDAIGKSSSENGARPGRRSVGQIAARRRRRDRWRRGALGELEVQIARRTAAHRPSAQMFVPILNASAATAKAASDPSARIVGQPGRDSARRHHRQQQRREDPEIVRRENTSGTGTRRRQSRDNRCCRRSGSAPESTSSRSRRRTAYGVWCR